MEYNLRGDGEKLISYWVSQGLPISRGASEQQIAQFEAKYQVSVPPDMHDYLVSANGMILDPNYDQDQNGFSFWPLQRIITVEEEARRIRNNSIRFRGAECFFVFCDYLTWCWAYAIRLSRDQSVTNDVVIVGKEIKKLKIASSFAEFIDIYIHDSPKLYGRMD